MIERGGSNAIGLTKLQYAKHRIRELEALAQWCKPDEHSPPEHWAAYRACFTPSGEADV